MKKILVLFILSIILACSNEGQKLTVEATVKGLKKGTVYLKKVVDTTLVTVDSVTVNGDSNFTLQADIEEPEVFHLYLDKNSKEEDRISFFGDKGVTKIDTKLENFNFQIIFLIKFFKFSDFLIVLFLTSFIRYFSFSFFGFKFFVIL